MLGKKEARNVEARTGGSLNKGVRVRDERDEPGRLGEFIVELERVDLQYMFADDDCADQDHAG